MTREHFGLSASNSRLSASAFGAHVVRDSADPSERGVLGLTSIPPDVIEASDAVGMTRRQRLTLVDIPLAAPVAMAGLRTSQSGPSARRRWRRLWGRRVWEIIFSPAPNGELGLRTLWMPCGGFARHCHRRASRHRRTWRGQAAHARSQRGPRDAGHSGSRRRGAGAFHRSSGYVIAAKNFSEQFILADLIAARMREAGLPSTTKRALARRSSSGRWRRAMSMFTSTTAERCGPT